MSNEPSSLMRLPKLTKLSEYLQWKHRIHVYIRREDAMLAALSDQPMEYEEVKIWKEKSAKAKSTIILCLVDSVLANTRAIVDDDERSAKDLWVEQKRMFTTSSQQAITNLHNRLNGCTFNEKGYWNGHISLFMLIIDDLASYDQPITDGKKVAQLIPSLPHSFEILTIVFSMTSTSFDTLISSVHDIMSS